MRKKRIKLSKAELLNRTIDRWQAKQEGAVIMLRKSAEMLAKLHRQRRRMLATAQMPRPVEQTLEPEAPTEHPRIEAKEMAIANALVEEAEPVRAITYSEAHPHSKKGPKRKPKVEAKPESGSPGPAILEEYLNRPFVEARTARMKSLGFRSTKGKKTPA